MQMNQLKMAQTATKLFEKREIGKVNSFKHAAEQAMMKKTPTQEMHELQKSSNQIKETS